MIKYDNHGKTIEISNLLKAFMYLVALYFFPPPT